MEEERQENEELRDEAHRLYDFRKENIDNLTSDEIAGAMIAHLIGRQVIRDMRRRLRNTLKKGEKNA